jgi:hypothetical protein
MTDSTDGLVPDLVREASDGWRLRLEGTSISYRYVGLTDFAFEIWQRGDQDVTVRLLAPFTFGVGGAARTYDPRATPKSELAPLLNLGSLVVDEVFIARHGGLTTTLSDGSRLEAPPTADGCAWRLEWPVEGDVVMEALAGGGVAFPPPRTAEAATPPKVEPDIAKGSRVPVGRSGGLDLPIEGLITMSPVSDLSIELMATDAGTVGFCLHFGGPMEIADPAGDVWHGHGDADERASLGPVLDLVGRRVTGALVDEEERLHLTFDTGVRVDAAPGRWEAHWPNPGGLDDYWVPREGPSIP